MFMTEKMFKYCMDNKLYPRVVAVKNNTLDFTGLKKKYKENKAILFVSLNLPITYNDLGLGKYKGSHEQLKQQFEIVLNPYHLRELLEQVNITIENMKKVPKRVR